MTMQNKIAIFPGTFDPITLGHRALLIRASGLFDKIIVAVAKGKHKEPLFSHEKRIILCKEALANIKQIEVIGFSGLLSEFAKLHNIKWIMRGVRNEVDFSYESKLAGVNKILNPDLETIFLPASDDYKYISSSMIREIISLNGDVSSFVPENILKLLQKS